MNRYEIDRRRRREAQAERIEQAGLGIGQQKRRLAELLRCQGCGEAGCTGTCGDPRGGLL